MSWVSPQGVGNGSVTTAKLATSTIDALMPWHVSINPPMVPDLLIGTTTLYQTYNVYYAVRRYNASNANNDEVGWDVMLAAGTWEMTMYYAAGPNFAICSMRVDGTEVDSVDCYNAAGLTENNVRTKTGIAVAASGKRRVSLKANGRNASNTTGYYIGFCAIELRRTA